MRRFILTIVVLTASLAVIAGAWAQEHRYAFIVLPTLGQNFEGAGGINTQGDVVGGGWVPGLILHATLWIEDQVFDLGTLGGPRSFAYAINNDRWIAGISHPPGQGGFNYRATLWRGNEIIDLGTLGGDWSEAYAINEAEQIVGRSEIIPGQGTPYRGFLWENGQMTELGTLGGRLSQAEGINSSGLIAGWAGLPDFGPGHAVLWDNGQIIDLGTLRQGNLGSSQAFGINDLGHVVGVSSSDRTALPTSFLWIDGNMYDLGIPRETQESWAEAINNHGQVVGTSYWERWPNSGFYAFLWEEQRGMQRLDDLFPPLTNLGAWRDMSARDINDVGQITGNFQWPDFSSRAFLMTPVYPTLELLGPHPGRAGERNTIAVRGAPPSATVHFLYSTTGGGTRIPNCDLQRNALQLESPTLIASTRANTNGVARLSATVPPSMRNQTVLLQAVIASDCAISQLVVHRFE